MLAPEPDLAIVCLIRAALRCGALLSRQTTIKTVCALRRHLYIHPRRLYKIQSARANGNYVWLPSQAPAAAISSESLHRLKPSTILYNAAGRSRGCSHALAVQVKQSQALEAFCGYMLPHAAYLLHWLRAEQDKIR